MCRKRMYVASFHYHYHELNSFYQISTCSGLAALDLANTRKSAGLRVTGVGASICAHQGCIRPLGLGDLQKGERCVDRYPLNILFDFD